MEEKLDLPSGRALTLRVPSAADYWRVQEHLPDLLAAPSEPQNSVKATAASIQLVCDCSVAPRLWCDLRDSAQRNAQPLKVPPGMTEFDLSVADLVGAVQWLAEKMQEQANAVRPIAGTAAT